jgi:hypothetical protein
MPTLRNNSERIIYVDGTMILPKTEGDVSDEAMKHSGVVVLLELKHLEVIHASPPKAAPVAHPVPPPPKA